MTTMLASDLPLPRIGRGKVRDIYAVGDDRVLLLTTDRISAFDIVMAETIPMKGAVLTQISTWWFRECPPLAGISEVTEGKVSRRRTAWLATQCSSHLSPQEFPANREFYREFAFLRLKRLLS